MYILNHKGHLKYRTWICLKNKISVLLSSWLQVWLRLLTLNWFSATRRTNKPLKSCTVLQLWLTWIKFALFIIWDCSFYISNIPLWRFKWRWASFLLKQRKDLQFDHTTVIKVLNMRQDDKINLTGSEEGFVGFF